MNQPQAAKAKDAADQAILDRILKLMRLSMNNPNVEEARSAAKKAIELMFEHEVLIQMPKTAAPPPQVPPPTTWNPDLTYESFMQRNWDEMLRKSRGR